MCPQVPSDFEEMDLSRVRTNSIRERGSVVTIRDFGDPASIAGAASPAGAAPLSDEAARGIETLARSIRESAAAGDREIVWMMGAHVVKCGLSRYVIDLLRRGCVTAVAMNGAAAIHDFEIAAFGETSEDVARNLDRGVFGFARETAEGCFEAVRRGREEGRGLGESLGRALDGGPAPHAAYSILAAASRLGVPVTVHVAIGTDIIHQHPSFDGAAWGELSARDFRIFAARVERLGRAGGVAVNAGSAVICPEVFLKAFSVARNLGAPFDRLVTANLDMIQHYRPRTNVLARPSGFGGLSVAITGRHEAVIPLLHSLVVS